MIVNDDVGNIEYFRWNKSLHLMLMNSLLPTVIKWILILKVEICLSLPLVLLLYYSMELTLVIIKVGVGYTISLVTMTHAFHK